MKRRKFWVLKPCYILLLTCCAGLLAAVYLLDLRLFLILLPVIAAVVAYTSFRFVNLHKDIYRFLKNIGEHLNSSHSQNMFQLPMPAAVISPEREIVWYNDAFKSGLLTEHIYGSSLNRITYLPLEELMQKQGIILALNGRYFKAYTIATDEDTGNLYLLYFIEVTELQDVMLKYQATRPVVMLILLDSYEEIIKNARESERTQILSEINRLLENYIAQTNGFIKRLERDRYLAVIEKQHFDQMVEDKFKLLNDAKNIMNAERLPVTLSIGIGMQADTLEKNERDAQQSLEMALGRGGDQVAIKMQGGFQFYGGTSKGVEKRTKVKSRILASAMAELIQNSENVLIMGHRFADLDAVGSAIGMARACSCLGKLVNIVVDQDKCLASALIDHHQKFGKKGLFISPEEALTIVKRNTLLFVLDTHSPHFVESTEVYKSCKNVVVIDHHRKMVDYIDNAVIFFHEPYASSTSEMVTELVQYFGEDCVLEPYHAESLLAGIMLDTKNFIMKTGVRTFEAAAYLKKMGADTVEVRRLFSSSMGSYQNKTKLVSAAEIYNRCAIVSSEILTNDIRVLASQAADELLDINDVDASFVMYEENNAVNVSARSMGSINVQVIMEKLGGGGHQTMAAAQIPHTDYEKVKQQLLQSIDEYYGT